MVGARHPEVASLLVRPVWQRLSTRQGHDQGILGFEPLSGVHSCLVLDPRHGPSGMTVEHLHTPR